MSKQFFGKVLLTFHIVVVVYIFRHFNQYLFTDFNKDNNEKERSSGTTGTGVSQKDPQISKKQEKKKTLKS